MYHSRFIADVRARFATGVYLTPAEQEGLLGVLEECDVELEECERDNAALIRTLDRVSHPGLSRKF